MASAIPPILDYVKFTLKFNDLGKAIEFLSEVHKRGLNPVELTNYQKTEVLGFPEDPHSIFLAKSLFPRGDAYVKDIAKEIIKARVHLSIPAGKRDKISAELFKLMSANVELIGYTKGDRNPLIMYPKPVSINSFDLA